MIQGLLLAAGAGSRMGMPKALVRDSEAEDGPYWVERAVDVLQAGGCAGVTVVLGAGAEQARAVLGRSVHVVIADQWREGMSESLRAGLRALSATHATAALVHLVDLPDVGAEVVRRLLSLGSAPSLLARAVYEGNPGHPVVIGADHWEAVAATATADAGARDYLRSREVVGVECSDLATGRDVDAR